MSAYAQKPVATQPQDYRIAGGAPAGIIRPPGEEGCRTTRTSIRIMTIQGNSNTAPRGTEIFELPFSRMRLLKKDNLGANRSFSLLRSLRDGRAGVEGIRLMRLLTNPMAVANPPQCAQRLKAKARANPENHQYPGDSIQLAQENDLVLIEVHRSEDVGGKQIGVPKVLRI